MTLISRVFGFARDMVIARVFGAGLGADAFFVAFRIPNFFRRLFAEGAFSQAFVPVLSEYKANRDHPQTKQLVDSVTGVLAGILFLLTILGVLLSPLIILVFAPGFIATPDKFDLTVSLLRITFPYLLFISLTALAGGVLNTYGRFGVPAFTPVFLNLSMIAAAMWLAPRLETPITALAWGVFLGGLVQLIFQAPFLWRLRLLPRPRIRMEPGVRRILKLMGPGLFGVSVSQINLLVNTLIASFLVTGSVSWLYYADRLMEFPLGVFGIALATVILPSLSEKHATGSTRAFSQTVDWALRWVIVIGTPASIGLAAMSGPLLCTLFQYGEFTAHDVVMASRSLVAFSFGLVAFALIKILAPGYFSRQDTKTPVRIGVIAMFANVGLSIVLVIPLAHTGLALATSLAAFLNAGLLYGGLRKSGVYQPNRGWPSFLARVGMANFVMAAVLLTGVEELSRWLDWNAWQRGWYAGVWIVCAALVYFLSLLVLGLRWRDMVAPSGAKIADLSS